MIQGGSNGIDKEHENGGHAMSNKVKTTFCLSFEITVFISKRRYFALRIAFIFRRFADESSAISGSATISASSTGLHATLRPRCQTITDTSQCSH